MSKTWITSDLHFGHTNIIKFCNRPFANADEMDGKLIRQWRQTVEPEDIVYFLGDFTMSHRKESALTFLAQLTGKIKVVLGNHDDALRKIHSDDPNVWFEVLSDVHEIKYSGERFVLCHYPLEEWNLSFRGSKHLHGHCHANRGFASAKNRWDVGWDSKRRIFNMDEFLGDGPK